MRTTDPIAEERAFYDKTDYSELELERADDVHVVHRPGPRSTFAVRLDGGTIDDLREVAARYGTRPTQIAREWLVERLKKERQLATPDLAAEVRRLEDRIGGLERQLTSYVSGSYTRGARVSGAQDVDVIVSLEAQAGVARELITRLADQVSVELSADPGADLIVRGGSHSWVVQFKAGTVDLVPSFDHIVALAKRLKARPVLVSPQPASFQLDAIAISAGVLVTSPDDLDELIDEILSYIAEPGPVPSQREHGDVRAKKRNPVQRRRPVATPQSGGETS